jgi:CheY-like chemotaxis protein
LKFCRKNWKESLDYEVAVARNGLEALKLALFETPDFIIADLMLPEMDGFQVASQIRKNPKTRAIPMLATTAITMREVRERCLACGFDGCIGKPFTLSELNSAIEKIFKEHSIEARSIERSV